MITELIDRPLPAPISRHPRTPGIHVSSVIRNIALLNGVLKPEWAPEDISLIEAHQENWWGNLDEDSQLRIAMGLAWEEWYIPQLGDVLDHPGEMLLDGIYMTHDGESLDFIHSEIPDEFSTDFNVVAAESLRGIWKPAIHEVKLTYKSLNTVGDMSGQWLWLAQTKAYCIAKGTNICYIHVVFVCGDYKYPLKPKRRIFKITYTEAELNDNWDTICAYVQHQLIAEQELREESAF